MKVKQLSLFLENKPGSLSRPVKLLAKARTLWCPLDAKTLKPTEPSPAIRARFSSTTAED